SMVSRWIRVLGVHRTARIGLEARTAFRQYRGTPELALRRSVLASRDHGVVLVVDGCRGALGFGRTRAGERRAQLDALRVFLRFARLCRSACCRLDGALSRFLSDVHAVRYALESGSAFLLGSRAPGFGLAQATRPNQCRVGLLYCRLG